MKVMKGGVALSSATSPFFLLQESICRQEAQLHLYNKDRDLKANPGREAFGELCRLESW